MSSNIKCKDPFGYKSGLEDGNPSGPSPLNIGELFASSSSGTLKKVSKQITIDSVFSSFSLSQDGGNWSRSGYLYEIWIDGFINNSAQTGNIVNGGKRIFLLDELTLEEYDLVVIDTQDVDDDQYGNITKILAADPLYLEDLLDYVNLIGQGEQIYSIGSIPLTEYSGFSLFDLDNDIDHRINFISADRSKIIDRPLLSCSSNTSGSMELCFSSSESILTYPQLVEENSLRLEKIDNPQSGFEVKINASPTYIGQLSDQTPGDVYYSTFFLTESLGWSAGVTSDGNPSILKTVDSGETWQNQAPSTLRKQPHSVYFIDDQTGFIVGDSSLFLQTSDGGDTWSETDLFQDAIIPGNVNFNSVHGNENLLWIVGTEGSALKFDIDTETWTLQNSTVSESLNSVYFIDTDYGWAVGNTGTVIETEDGGSTWVDKTSVSGTTENLHGVYFTSSTRGYACGDNGIIIRTNTDGDSWTTRDSETDSSLRSISFINSNIGFCVGFSGVLTVTEDGGITWNSSSIGGYANLYSVQMLNSDNIWVSGDDTYIKNSVDGGETWNSKYPPNTPINLRKIRVGKKVSLNVIPPLNIEYIKGRDVVVSKSLVDIRSGSYGVEYFKAKVLSLNGTVLDLTPTFKPQNSFVAGSRWYIISETDQINIPISDNYYFSLLSDSEILQYNVISCISSARLQITKNSKFNKFTLRYKPENSSEWKYLTTTELNTQINNLLPNTIYWYEIMGINTYTNEYSGFSSIRSFNTFY